MSEPVRWGVLGVAKIATEKVIPAMQRGKMSRIEAIASRDGSRARAAAEQLGIPKAYGSYEELLADPEYRGDLQSAAQRASHALDRKGACGRQACALREADRSRRRGSPTADRRARGIGQAGRGSVHGALSSAMAPRAGNRAIRRDRRSLQRSRRCSPTACSIPKTSAIALPAAADSTISAATRFSTARFIFGAEPLRVAASLNIDPQFGTDRLVSAIVEFPGGRHLTFSAGTQLAGAQRVCYRRDRRAASR